MAIAYTPSEKASIRLVGSGRNFRLITTPSHACDSHKQATGLVGCSQPVTKASVGAADMPNEVAKFSTAVVAINPALRLTRPPGSNSAGRQHDRRSTRINQRVHGPAENAAFWSNIVTP